MKNVIRKVLCWPLFFGTLIALVVRALWGESMRWENAVLVTVLSEKSWPMRSWYQKWGGTCFGYGIMLAPNQGSSRGCAEKTRTAETISKRAPTTRRSAEDGR